MQPPQKLARSSCSPATCLSRKTTRKGIQLCRLRRLHGRHPDIRGHDSKVWNNPNHRIWPISQCSYLPGEVWGWNAFCFRFQQIQWTDDSVSWYFTPPQFTFFWWGGERMINIQWSRIMTKYELMIGKDLYWLQYIINIDKSWYKSWGGDVNGIYKPWEFSLSVQDGEMRYILHGVGYFVGQEAHWPCHGCLVRLVRG